MSHIAKEYIQTSATVFLSLLFLCGCGILRPWQPLNDEVQSLYQQGQYARAVVVAQQALEVAEKAVGPNHPDVATILSFLATLYEAQGQYAQAEPLAKRALAIREQVLGPNHPDVAKSLNNLATLYDLHNEYVGHTTNRGMSTQAEPLYKRALAIWEQALGPNHLAVAAGLNNLAELYRHQGQYAQAEPLYQRALAIREQALGPNHPAVATILENLAMLYRKTGRDQEAEPLEKRAQAIRAIVR